MIRRSTLAWTTAALALCAASTAFAQSDREVVESTVARSANVCPGHSKDRTTPTVKLVPVGGLRVLLDKGLVMCPDRRLDADAPAVWYGQWGVYAWNPEVADAGKVVAAQIDKMTRDESFPTDTLVWGPKGEELKNRTVPAFEPRPGAAVRVKVH
ncbi:hypothetical protein CAL29_25200 [Bordetella genomosp. 10]|uniref:Secreted protein n=1 Tax=Bordetella genomosp. 10 TaxID=1416804 RepID=A0A261S1L5_9BORD|nr:hypothetical protein [Bordetella genomosp. 10]OZI31228.1 hypothetical protein CAL29_25200 [Bordetella genomosp. 10]